MEMYISYKNRISRLSPAAVERAEKCVVTENTQNT